MNQQLVLIAIGVVVAAFILRPLLRGRAGRTRATPASPAPAAATSEQLSELELDRAMGRISDEDYARWRRELEDAPQAGTAAVASSVNESAAAAPPVIDATSRAEALVRRWREAPRPTCPTCGIRPEPEARFCSNCGASLTS
jgi:cytochrome c-type biogenesis protein CcmI